jgi:hypothetical protein
MQDVLVNLLLPLLHHGALRNTASLTCLFAFIDQTHLPLSSCKGMLFEQDISYTRNFCDMHEPKDLDRIYREML